MLTKVLRSVRRLDSDAQSILNQAAVNRPLHIFGLIFVDGADRCKERARADHLAFPRRGGRLVCRLRVGLLLSCRFGLRGAA